MSSAIKLNLENFNLQKFPWLLEYPDLSLKAKALFVIILHWRVDFMDPKMEKEKFLLRISREKIDAIRSGIRELQNEGFLQKRIQRNQNGRKYIIGSSWELMIEWPGNWMKGVEE